jgi:serine phosphatase RsbU (regulator of sigma subunit)/anti-sigma regulatory factor (Ser/Thr protein kinase)
MDEFTVMAVLSATIALAYVAMAASVAPRLALPPAGRGAATALFAAAGLTHAILAYRVVDAEPAWLAAWYVLALHAVLVVAAWTFVIVVARGREAQAARRLSQAAEGFAEAQDLAGVGAWEWHPGRDRLRPSREFAALLGRAPGWRPHLVDLLAMVVPADRDRARSVLRDVADAPAGAEPAEFEIRITRADGAERHVLTRAVARGGLVVAASLDVTERRAAEAAEAEAEREHRIAETLQRSLLPVRLPDVPSLELAARYLPAGDGAQVGGDWYDVIELPNGEIALVMGDVVGRGIPAAALVGKLRNALRAYTVEGHPPERALEHLNALVDRAQHEMATVLLVVVSPRDGRARWVSAGHPPALVRRADGGRLFLEGGRSVPLGAMAHAEYEAAEDVLAPGDVLLLYTDGLVERRDVPLDERFERLRLAAERNGSAMAICDATLSALLPGGAGGDDVALLAAMVRAPEPALDFELEARPEELPRLRRRLEAWLSEFEVDRALIQRIVLSVNEAAANAVEHAYGPGHATFAVHADAQAPFVAVEVRDHGRWRLPRGEDGGRGLLLMRELADVVEVEHDAEGTRVRLEWAR